MNTRNENKAVTDVSDIGLSNNQKITGYVSTTNGSLNKYDPSTGKISTISTQMPSDTNDPTKKNNNNGRVEKNPVVVPKPIKLFEPSPLPVNSSFNMFK